MRLGLCLLCDPLSYVFCFCTLSDAGCRVLGLPEALSAAWCLVAQCHFFIEAYQLFEGRISHNEAVCQ